MENLDKLKKDFLDSQINKMLKQQSRDMEDVIIKFLRLNGFRPKRTVKYAKYLKRKLEKQGLRLVIDKVNEQIECNDSTYIHKYYLVPRFEEIKKNEQLIKK